MKKILLSLVVLGMGCGAFADDLFAPHGVLYGDTVSPYSTYFDSSVAPRRTGEATCKSYFLLVAKGNCSIQNAMRDGDITKIQSIDRKNKNILFYQKSTIVVHGE